MKNFRIRSKKFFLTYPRCNLNLEDVLLQLQEKVKEKSILSFNLQALSKEKHDSEANLKESSLVKAPKDLFHIHVFFEVESTLDVGNSAFFDLQDPKNPTKVYHGHQESARKKNNVIRQLLKNQDHPLTEILISEDLKQTIKGLDFLSQSELIIKLGEEGKIREALEYYKKNLPQKQLQSAGSVKKTLNQLQEEKLSTRSHFKLEDFKVPSYLNKKIRSFFESESSDKSLWFYGGSGQGKSQQIQALSDHFNLNYLVVNDLEAFKKFEVNQHQLIIFDDFPLPTDINQIRDLFEPKSETGHRILQNFIFIRNCKRIFISNLSLVEALKRSLNFKKKNQTKEEILSLIRRVKEIQLKKPLFKISQEEKEDHKKLRDLIRDQFDL